MHHHFLNWIILLKSLHSSHTANERKKNVLLAFYIFLFSSFHYYIWKSKRGQAYNKYFVCNRRFYISQGITSSFWSEARPGTRSLPEQHGRGGKEVASLGALRAMCFFPDWDQNHPALNSCLVPSDSNVLFKAAPNFQLNCFQLLHELTVLSLALHHPACLWFCVKNLHWLHRRFTVP